MRRRAPWLFPAVSVLLAASPLQAVPVHLWSQRFGDANYQVGRSIAVDGSGNIVITGELLGSADFGGGPLTSAGLHDIFVAMFAPDGTHLWSQRFGDAGYQVGRSIAVDGSGNIVVTGMFAGTVDFGGGPLTSAGSYDIFVAEFEASGVHLWSRSFGDAQSQGGHAVTTDASGNVVVTGYFYGTVTFGRVTLTSAGNSDVFVAKLDASGTPVWSQSFGDPDNQEGSSVAADGAGNVVVTGELRGTVDFGGGPLTSAGVQDIFVAEFDPNGLHLWSQSFGDANIQTVASVAVDGADHVILAGEFRGSVDFGGGPLASAGDADVFVAKFDAGGAHLWSKRFGNADYQGGYAVAVDGSDNLVLTGTVVGATDFGGGPVTGAGGWDIVVAKLDAGGTHLWSQGFGDAGSQVGISGAVDGSANVVITGWFADTLDFGGGPLTSAGGGDIYVAKLGDRATPVSMTSFEGTLGQNFPNPFNPTTTIEYTLNHRSRAVVSIYDATGVLVRRLDQGVRESGTFRVEWDGRDESGGIVASGVYFYRLEGVNGVTPRKMVLLK